jgi:hypothetical protein
VESPETHDWHIEATVRPMNAMGTINLTQSVQKLGYFGSLRTPLSSVLDQVEAGIGKKIAKTSALVD